MLLHYPHSGSHDQAPPKCQVQANANFLWKAHPGPVLVVFPSNDNENLPVASQPVYHALHSP